MKVGDTAICLVSASWCHGIIGTIAKLNVISGDGVRGHQVSIPGHGITIVPRAMLVVVKNMKDFLNEANKDA